MSLSLHRNKGDYFSLFIIGIILIFILTPFIHDGIPNTHDGINQVARFGSYVRALQDYHFPPRWAGYLNHGYGIPVFNFFYPLPGYIVTAVTLIFQASLESSFKTVSIGSTILGGLGWYIWSRRYGSPGRSLLICALAVSAPYQILNLYVRGDIGETLAYAIIPYIFLSLTSHFHSGTYRSLAVATLLTGLCILSHNGVSLMIFPFLFSLAFVNLLKQKNGILRFLFYGLGSLATSCYFWFPALIEHKYTLAGFFISNMYKDHFLPFTKLIYSLWGFKADVNASNGLSPQIGILIAIFFTICCITLLRNKIQRTRSALLFLFMAIIGAFFSLPVSQFFWQHISLLPAYQFPWRFIGLATTGCLAFITLVFPKKIPIYIVIFGLLGLSIQMYSFVSVSSYIHHSDNWYYSFPGTTFFHGEALTRWSEGEAREYPTSKIEFIEGSGSVMNLTVKNHELSFNIDATKKTKTRIRINTLYYPGWKVRIDTTPTDIEFQDQNHRGIITVSVPSGKHQVTAKFTETKTRLFTNTISFFSIICLATYGVLVELFTNKDRRRTLHNKS